MLIRRILILLVAFGVLAAACGGGSISADNCDDLADETMQLFQNLIDDVDSEFEDMSVEEFIATGGDLPSIDRFKEDAVTIDELAAELGCTQSEIAAAVQQRLGDLTAESDLGRFLIDSIRSGGL
ncbi:MAG: hypothetical protein BMS9Abin12_1099 [Acidimicrobiia bacterium]|nr:MAG: hypothetical protein BMS9Abin12_1099 [Acidimicrobiia bacterium]